MKQFATKRFASAIALALMFGAAGMASAATTKTGNLTFTGTLTDAPPPASCNIVSAPSVDATYTIPNGGIASFIKSTSMTVNCTSGTNFSLTAPADLNPLARGADPAGLTAQVLAGFAQMNIATTPYAAAGTGANQVIAMNVVFKGKAGGMINTGETGAVSGSIVLSVAY
jgi:ABC-type glycerol-3-phosphate transport system substrate-binding protein